MQQGSLIPQSFVASMRLIPDVNCMEDTEERLFPESRHRSARIRKKLIKRYGGAFRKEPTAFRIGGDRIVAHPAIIRQIEQELSSRKDRSTHATIMGNLW